MPSSTRWFYCYLPAVQFPHEYMRMCEFDKVKCSFFHQFRGQPALRTVTFVYILDSPLFMSNKECAVDRNNTLLVWLALSHTQDRHTQRNSLPDLHRGWSGRAKIEDKKQLSIQNSQSGHTHTRITHRQMTERNVNLTQEIISGLEKKKRKKGGHLQQLNLRSSSFWVCLGDTKNVPAGKERGEKPQCWGELPNAPEGPAIFCVYLWQTEQ